jgi:cellulose synthase/poly-beta-1,6-N-acetylglucosamine synthase-like glycosyltransferase
VLDWLIIIVYLGALSLITLFSLGQLNLTYHYSRKKPTTKSPPLVHKWPSVTIQLPIYNEKYVVQRLIKSVLALDYPAANVQIQILDDSTDETTEIIEQLLANHTSNIKIDHIRRKQRTGFKAGALQYGLEQASGEFIAIFDADFTPKSDFLKETLPHFNEEVTGMVQTRWGHINENYSVLTQLQAFGLNAHFTVEQSGRQSVGSPINFNGTAGVWRKQCIVDAGGWEHDTLTEDLDLSYRAQLKGWTFKYLEDITSPAELPIEIPAIKSQQFRWNKGAAETAKKTIPEIFKSNLSFEHKVRGLLHLCNSTVFLYLLIASVFSIPMLYIKARNPDLSLLFNLASVFVIGFIAIGIFYWTAVKAIRKRALTYYLRNFPLFMIFSMGLALHNSIAIIEGLIGIKTPFVRTPKFNVSSDNKSVANNYSKRQITFLTFIEGVLAAYFGYGVYAGIVLGDYGLLLFHMMLFMGFGGIFILSFKRIPNET